MSEELDIDIEVLREKQEIIREVSEHLSQISSIGNSTILIEKIKIIVNLSKQLLEGFDELTINRTSNHLTMLVSNAKIIAADPTSVTPEAIRSLTRSRDKLAQQLSRLNTVLEQNVAGRVHNSLHGNGSNSEANSQDREKEQLELLARYRGDLRAKKDVQQSFILEGDPATMLEEVVSEFLGCTKSLQKSYEVGSNPSKCEILRSLCGIASSVLRLLDLVDSLFVSKFPMRKQVYSFTEKLLELGMAYKPVERKGGREGDAIRDMRKQLPALNNSAQVMLEQLEERVRDLTASRQKSMKRRQALSLLGSQELDAMSLREPRREDNRGSRSLHLRLICHVCCTSAKQANNGDPIKRGSVLRLEVSGDANIRELKEQLSEYTGIPVKYVLPRFPGVEQPPDNEVELGDLFGGGDIKDVFLFDLSSSEGLPEDELRELRRLAVAQMSIDSYDWDTEWAGDIAQATVDYDVTEPGHLSFIEGELLRVLERKTDGWWRGEVNGVTGIFYKTFVVELQRESRTSVPTNFKQVAFIGKPKQSFLTKKKSEDTVTSPAEKKLLPLRSLSRQESGDAQKTPDAKKKMSHISISLETETSPPNSSPPKQEHHPEPVKPEPAALLDRSASYVREKDNSYERKLSNRLISINIDELIDQLTEYSGIEVPPTPDTPQSSKVTSVTNIGFEPESPNQRPNPIDNISDLSTTTSLVNPTQILGEEDLYDSLEGVENSTELTHTSESVSEANPLYEKVELEHTALPKNKQEQGFEAWSQSDTPSRPPIPTSTRPPKLVPIEQPPCDSNLCPKPTKISGKKFRFGGQRGEKPEKDKSQARPKRLIFGRRQKLSIDNVLDEPSHTAPDSSLPSIPTDPQFNSDNSSTNNSNPVPIGEYTLLQIPDESSIGCSIYEQVDRQVKPIDLSPNENLIRPLITPASVNARTSHYEQVDLIPLPPRASKEQSAAQEEPGRSSGSADDLYSQVDFVKKNFRKIASMEEQFSSALSKDELASASAELGSGNETHNVIRSKSSSSTDDKIKSYPIYSLVTRKRDSIIIQDDEGDFPVCVSISPDKETESAFEAPIENSEPASKLRPILPPKTLSIEDVEIYIKEGDIEVGEVLLSPVDTFLPTCKTSPASKKRFSHYQEITNPSSPTLPARMLTEDEFYEEVTGRHRASSFPHHNSTAETVKTPLEIRHSADQVQRIKVTIDQNLTPLPPIPVNTESQTMDEDPSEYETIESVMGSRAPKKFADQVQAIKDNPLSPTPADLRSQYIEALMACVSILLQSTTISHSLFTKDNSQHTRKLIKSIELGQPLNVDYKTSPAILASLIRLILKNGKLGPIFPIAVTDTLLVLVKNDKPQPILHEIYSLLGLSKFIRDFIYLLYINFCGLNEKKKQEFITALSALFFEDTSRKNIDNCRHILRFLIEHYPTIFQV